MCHSENKYGDKQNKNRGALKLCIENTYNRKQNKNCLTQFYIYCLRMFIMFFLFIARLLASAALQHNLFV